MKKVIENIKMFFAKENISAGEVSTMNKNLDEMVKAFQEQPLEKEMPVLWIDAVYEKIHVGKHVKSMAVMQGSLHA